VLFLPSKNNINPNSNTNMDIEQLKFPIGKFVAPSVYPAHLIEEKIAAIAGLPQQLSACLAGRTPEELSKTYRPDGWTVRQVLHHLADSHMNAFVRFKLSLTQADTPNINAYLEADWAQMNDSIQHPIEDSLLILQGMHQRWVAILNHMSNDDFEKAYFHPVQNRAVKLKEALAMYAWHSAHHLAHIGQALNA
jgi:DinB superfamily